MHPFRTLIATTSLLVSVSPLPSTAQESAVKTISPGELLAELAKPSLTENLDRRLRRTYGKRALQENHYPLRIEETTVAWATEHPTPVTVVRADGHVLGTMRQVDDKGLQALALELENFQEFPFIFRAGEGTEQKKIGGGKVRLEHYDYGAESFPIPGVPRGTVTEHRWEQSKVFPGTERDYLVYVPAQYDPSSPAALMVFQDGLRHADPGGHLRATTVFDNLIFEGAMPPTIGVFINPGSRHGQEKGSKPKNRSLEYDSLGDAYVRFLLEEILPEVSKDYKISDDPAMRAIAGGSSGAICAFTAAWERPDSFGKVLSWVGTFVDIRGGHNYPPLIRKTEPKPIRVYLLAGSNDLDNRFGNWPLANQEMAAALKFQGYDYHLNYGKCFHGSRHAGAILPEMLRWLWRDWDSGPAKTH